MTSHLLVIIHKEWVGAKSTLFSCSNWLSGLWPMLLFCAAIGVYEPLKIGPDWLQSPIMLLSISVLVPFVVIGSISPYAFVGERLHGTLEPLLATPVSDSALLFGKIATAVFFGWGAALASLLLGAGSLNVFLAQGRFLFYSPGILLYTILLSLLFSMLVATLGTAASLYAKTFLDAQRNLVLLLLLPLLLPAFCLGPLMPDAWKTLMVTAFPMLETFQLLPILIGLLSVVDGLIMLLARSYFHRKLLLLE